jgi:hypothetical protein
MRARPSARAGVVVVLAVLAGLTGCTAPGGGDGTTEAAPPQPDITGEWVVTRTVAGSDDPGNPAHVVGEESQRYLLVERDDCGENLCPGTVASGSSVDSRQEARMTQTADGFEYRMEGALDCLDSETGDVVSVGAFRFSQEAVFTIAASTGSGDDAVATELAGTILHTDSLRQDGLDDGCSREPVSATVEYTVSAVRAP